jgi:amino acid permease
MSVSGKPGRAPNWRSVFAMPLIIGLASAAGLLAALLLGEIGRYLAWLAVGSPIITVMWFGLRQGAKKTP